MSMDESQHDKLLADCKSYLRTRYDLLRLSLLDKLSRILGLVLLALVVVLLLFAFLAFAALALVFVLAQWVPMWGACLIIGGVYLLLLVLAIAFRKQWFVNPLIGTLSAILFADDNGKETDHD